MATPSHQETTLARDFGLPSRVEYLTVYSMGCRGIVNRILMPVSSATSRTAVVGRSSPGSSFPLGRERSS